MGRLVKKRVFILIIFFSENIRETHANGKRLQIQVENFSSRKYADKMKTAQSNSYG